jgi:aryl-alcohol dehydrogenase-like predicted oxidoreductase
MAWVLHKPGVTAPIVGASKTEHLDDAIKALSLALTAEETTALEAPYVPHRVVGFA